MAGSEDAGAVSGDALLQSVACATKCAKLLAALRGRTVALGATGSKENNALDKLLRCECKERKICRCHLCHVRRRACLVLASDSSCSLRSDALSVYSACHSGVMSVGSHKGKSHCGAELAALHACVFGR